MKTIKGALAKDPSPRQQLRNQRQAYNASVNAAAASGGAMPVKPAVMPKQTQPVQRPTFQQPQQQVQQPMQQSMPQQQMQPQQNWVRSGGGMGVQPGEEMGIQGQQVQPSQMQFQPGFHQQPMPFNFPGVPRYGTSPVLQQQFQQGMQSAFGQPSSVNNMTIQQRNPNYVRGQ